MPPSLSALVPVFDTVTTISRLSNPTMISGGLKSSEFRLVVTAGVADPEPWMHKIIRTADSLWMAFI
jgi:hypothetical protein